MRFLKSFFRAAHQDLRPTQDQTTAASAGDQANHTVIPSGDQPQHHASDSEFDRAISEEAHALEAIANLVTASATDKSNVETITKTNEVLVKEIASLRKEIISLRSALQPFGTHLFGTNTNDCCSFSTKSSHPSHKRENKKPNHQLRTTAANMMGGETRTHRPSV